MTDIAKHSEYNSWVHNLKLQIKTRQIKAAISVNSQMIMLYWDLGRQITEKQEKTKWGSGFIEQLSKDLRKEFPEMTGFSTDNLIYMRKFYQFYSNPIITEQVVRQIQVPEKQQDTITAQLVRQLISIPWGHHTALLRKVKNLEEALFYVHKTVENNWSRAVLEYQIEIKLYERQGKAVTNFPKNLPEPQSDLANEIMKSPYNFEFLRLSDKAKETDLEKALVQHISQFLLELGMGFAYMGRQFPLKVGDSEYRIDLLFYHTRLRCYVVIELKTREFEPEYIGKLNSYITAVNELIKGPHDNPTIGMLLCKNKDNYKVQFSLKDINNPIGVSTFENALPSVEDLQNELLNFERKNVGSEENLYIHKINEVDNENNEL